VEEKYNIDKSKISREEFRKLCMKESEKVERLYADRVFRRLGHSFDWNLLYTTISEKAQKVAQTSFLRLIKQGNCYRAEEPVIYCVKHQTALAQAEVEDVTRETKLNYILFDLKDSNKKIEIATTRPELLPSCVGIFVHPQDKRYKELVGKKAIVPIFGQEVDMEDEAVKQDFGSGIVMVCTFGDTTDIEWWKKHKLKLIMSITEDGKLNENAGEFAGLTLEEARQAILAELEKQGRLVKQETIVQNVGTCWRCGTPVEFLVMKQWFIKTLEHKEKLIEMGRKIKWYPDFMRIRYENWVKNLKWDWCISRQRYYGVPIPVWYCEKCNEIILPEESELPVDPTTEERKCPKCGSTATPDKDVFDTWMTSSNTPEIALRWLENPELYNKLTPMSLRPQSHDIIRTWAFYTILKSLLLFNRVPWREIVINTFVLDEKGRGMSKSKGNVVWADDLLEKYSVDIFRYWVGTATLGSDLPFKEQELIAGKKFLTKLWNASRFAISHLQDYKPSNKAELEVMDKWILAKKDKMLSEVTKLYKSYNIAEAKKRIEAFFWRDFCDNYLEIIKDRLYNAERGEKARVSAQYTLYKVLLTILKLIAPITPFITEEIWQIFFRQHEPEISIHVSKWPEKETASYDKEFEIGELFISVLAKVRKKKTEASKSMRSKIKLKLEKEKLEKLKPALADLMAVTNALSIEEGSFNIEFVD